MGPRWSASRAVAAAVVAAAVLLTSQGASAQENAPDEPSVQPPTQPPVQTSVQPSVEPSVQTPVEPSVEPSVQAESWAGLLFGVRAGAIVPVSSKDPLGENTTVGVHGGIDAYLRLAKMILVGGSLEHARLAGRSGVEGPRKDLPADVTASTTAVAARIGFLPYPDRVSFIADVGFGWRTANVTFTTTTAGEADRTYTGPELGLGAGVSFPVGDFRLVTRANLTFGSFDRLTVGSTTTNVRVESTHALLFVGVAAYYSFDFGGARAPR